MVKFRIGGYGGHGRFFRCIFPQFRIRHYDVQFFFISFPRESSFIVLFVLDFLKIYVAKTIDYFVLPKIRVRVYITFIVVSVGGFFLNSLRPVISLWVYLRILY